MKCAGYFYALPAHHKPLQPSKRLRNMRRRSCCNLARLFGGGDWECQSLLCLFVPKNGCKGTHFRPIKCLFCVKKHKIGANGADFQRKAWWNGSFFVILASEKTRRGKGKAVASKKGRRKLPRKTARGTTGIKKWLRNSARGKTVIKKRPRKSARGKTDIKKRPRKSARGKTDIKKRPRKSARGKTDIKKRPRKSAREEIGLKTECLTNKTQEL